MNLLRYGRADIPRSIFQPETVPLPFFPAEFSNSFSGKMEGERCASALHGRRERKDCFLWRELVLLDRIELSTSPLPRECSTTELQQRRWRRSSVSRATPQVCFRLKSGINHHGGFFPSVHAVPAPQWRGSQSGGLPDGAGQWVPLFLHSSRNCRFQHAAEQG